MPRCRYCLMTLGGTFHYSGLEPNYVDVGGKDGDACAKSNDDVLRGPSVCFFFFFLFFLGYANRSFAQTGSGQT